VVALSDFSPRFGSITPGIFSAILAAMGYLVFPYIILTGLLTMLNGLDVSDASAWTSMFEDWRQIILILSLPLIALAFFKGFYWKGSYSRLSFAIVMTVIFAVLVWSLQLDGRVQAALDGEDFDLQFTAFIYFFLGFVAFWALFNVGEYLDERREFERRRHVVMNLPPPMPITPEDPRKHKWWHDFRLRYGSWAMGFKTARRYYGRFMVWPILFFMVVTATLLKVNDLVPFELQNQMEDAIMLLFWAGLAVVAMAFFKGFYPKGSVSRMSFWLVMVAGICVWIWIFLFGGRLAIEIADMVQLSVGFTPIVLILMFAASLWGVYAMVEYISYHRDWVINHFRAVPTVKRKSPPKVNETAQKFKEGTN
jgi:hypothetical protein